MREQFFVSNALKIVLFSRSLNIKEINIIVLVLLLKKKECPNDESSSPPQMDYILIYSELYYQVYNLYLKVILTVHWNQQVQSF